MKEAATTFRTSVRSPALAMWVRGLSASTSDGGGEGICSRTIAKNGQQELVSKGQSYVFSQRFPEAQVQMSRNKTTSSFQFRPITSKISPAVSGEPVCSMCEMVHLFMQQNSASRNVAFWHVYEIALFLPWGIHFHTRLTPAVKNDCMLLFGIKDGK